APPLPARHPAVVVTALVAAACVVVAASFRIFDTDIWQLLVAAKAMVQSHAIPHRSLWTWPLYGVVERNMSWLFRALLWPFWAWGGVGGLFAWRWLTTLAIFAIAWATARRMGARGLTAIVVVLMGALVYRQRSQVRPETLVGVLLALELWILETRRAGGPD